MSSFTLSYLKSVYVFNLCVPFLLVLFFDWQVKLNTRIYILNPIYNIRINLIVIFIFCLIYRSKANLLDKAIILRLFTFTSLLDFMLGLLLMTKIQMMVFHRRILAHWLTTI